MTASLPLLDDETRLQKPQFKTIMFRTVAADGAMMEAYHRAVERWEQRQRSALIALFEKNLAYLLVYSII